MNRLLTLVALAFLLCACQSFRPRAADHPGKLGLIHTDGNLYVADGASLALTPITTDATAPPQGTGLSYQRLVWHPKGDLAFASVERSANSAASVLYWMEEGGEPVKIGENAAHFVIYIYWSPQCRHQEPCRELAYLIEETEDQIGLRHVVERDGEIQNSLLGEGWPFYFSWSADGEEMVWHQNGGRLDNSVATFTEVDLRGNERRSADQQPGLLLAPAYSPTDPTQKLIVDADNRLLLLDLDSDAGGETVIAQGAGGDIAFVWSPSGQQIAYAIRARGLDPFYGPIMVYDLETETARRVIDVGLRSVGFFWSPDGQKIGYLQRMMVGNDAWFQWRVLRLADGEDTGYKPFNPTPQMRNMVASFGQYAQSHRLWSADSRYLVYMERSARSGDGIWLVDTEAMDGEPIFVAPGVLAFWSQQ